MSIRAVVATVSCVKARHKSSVFPLILLRSQPVTIYNGSKNKYSDGQRQLCAWMSAAKGHGCKNFNVVISHL